jgi:hypothetical protein
MLGENSPLFTPGPALDTPPVGEVERQAINSLRGYAYQVAASALAWLDLDETSWLYLEVAEDYATVAENALHATQVKDTAASGPATLQTESVREAIRAFVELVARNPKRAVKLRYLTTSVIGTERRLSDRPNGEAGLAYWRKAATGADIGPLRSILEGTAFHQSVRNFVSARDDDSLRQSLLQPIHWECAQPDMSGIQRELEERLVVLGRERYILPAPESIRLADVLMHHVLKKCTLKNPEERVLTRGELYSVIDGATRLFLPRSTMETLNQLAAVVAAGFGGAQQGVSLAANQIGWLIADNELAAPHIFVTRQGLEDTITKALRMQGLTFLTGATGLGKSWVARAIASKCSGEVVFADFRNAEQAETLTRLNLMLRHIGTTASRCFIIEDLDFHDEPSVSLSLSRVIEALRRRDRIGIVTSHRRPSARTLTELGMSAEAVVQVPYFSEKEASEAVRVAGGDVSQWGRVAFIAAAQGHPQLVNAYVTGMAARGWPEEAMHEVLISGLTSQDMESEREAARRSLTGALPPDARTLLYRLSLILGHFDRALALAVGSLPPPISRPGEQLEELVGAWIEALGNGRYRVSPLVSNAGREMLEVTEQQYVHNRIASQLLARRTGDTNDANMILTHSLLGKFTPGLIAIAVFVLRSNEETLIRLAENFFVLRLFRTETPIYSDQPHVSRFLRLAQFKLIAKTGNGPKINSCVTALLEETNEEQDARLRAGSECLALSTVLLTPGIAEHLLNWVDLFVRLMAVMDTTPDVQELKSNFERASSADGPSFYGSMFAIGAHGVASVRRLEEIIDSLDAIDATKRSLLLQEYDRRPGDYVSFVDFPWFNERDTIDPIGAAARYKRIAEKAQRWQTLALSARCHAARSVMLDEFAKDQEAAICALDEAVAAIGENVVLSRARAKIYFGQHDYSNAVKILRDIADRVGRDHPIERTFALRDAAISAANTNDWEQAEVWFAESRLAAVKAPTVDMQAMAVGLGADAAVAAFLAGGRDRGLHGLATSLDELRALDPGASLRAAYCHRVVRHTVLWARSQVGLEVEVDGKTIDMLPGTCSNPEPPPAIRELPLAHLDVAWYMLAGAEIAAGVDVGIANSLYQKLSDGPIPVAEAVLRGHKISAAIAQLDSASFAQNMRGWLEGLAYVLDKDKRGDFDPLTPNRGDIPRLKTDDFARGELQTSAFEANLAFCVVSALRSRADTIAELKKDLAIEIRNHIPGERLFKYFRGDREALSGIDKIYADAVAVILTGEHLEPRQVWAIGLRLFERARQSRSIGGVIPVLAEWLRSKWTRVLGEEGFRLSQPIVTVPEIERSLARKENDGRFIAALLLAAAPSVRASLGMPYRDLLEAIAQGVNQPIA